MFRAALALIVMVGAAAGLPLQRQTQAHPSTTQQQSDRNERAAAPAPIIVQVLPAKKTQHEAAEEKAERQDQSDANWWLVRLTAVLACIGVLQTVVFGWQARRLKQTIDKMDEIATGQTGDMQASIGQATRAAAAMEGVANAMADVAAFMATNVEQLKITVATNKQIADRQKLVSELQLRAYINAVIGAGIFQDRTKNLKFEGRVLLVNEGPTPAHKAKHICDVGIFPVPLANGFEFPKMGTAAAGENMIGPRQNRSLSAVLDYFVADDAVEAIKSGNGQGLYVWGNITYEDAFGQERKTDFCHLLTWLPNGNVWGYYTPNRNNAT